MNWPVVVVFAYVMLGLELALKPALAIETPGIAPSFVIPLAAFIALHAPAMPALWVALALGAALDLTNPMLSADGRQEVTVLGTMALGCLGAAYMALTIRGMLVRRNPLTLIMLAGLFALVASLVAVALLSVRSMYDGALVFHPVQELVRRSASAVYTWLVTIALAAVLMPLSGLFGFQVETHGRRMVQRTY